MKCFKLVLIRIHIFGPYSPLLLPIKKNNYINICIYIHFFFIFIYICVYIYIYVRSGLYGPKIWILMSTSLKHFIMGVDVEKICFLKK